MKNFNRRNFIRNASIGSLTAAGLVNINAFGSAGNGKEDGGRLPREVWIATLTQHNIHGRDLNENTHAALKQMENAVPFSPDVICLPEVFLNRSETSLESYAENGSGNIIAPFQAFAKKNHCYVICPVHTVSNAKFYNAAILIDRDGKNIGEYRKARLTEEEIDLGLTPGSLEVPVFQTDFGVIGIQICFDIEWNEGWVQLGRKGAEIVFWPSGFAAGKMINARAFQNKYCVVTSTWKNTTKICDVTGEELAASGNWSDWGVCAAVNLEKAFLHSWPYVQKFPEIQKKYGRKIRIYSLHEEEFSIIESLSADVKISEIMKEFDLKSYRQHIQSAEDKQGKFRPL